MNRTLLLASFAFAGLAQLRAFADGQISSERLNLLDQRGYFTPAFKASVHDLLQAQGQLAEIRGAKTKARAELPDLRRQCSEATAQTEKLRQELARYAHPQDADFDVLHAAMNAPAASIHERLALAQAFVWSYPTDPHQAEAQAYLQQIQQAISDQKLSASETSVGHQAARALLQQRAKAHELGLAEWQTYLEDMSQEELLRTLGRPQREGPDYWIYAGNWVTDPAKNARVGLRINFNGTRELSVVPSAP